VHRADDSSTSSSDPTWGRLLLGLGLPFVLTLAAILAWGWRNREALRLPDMVRAQVERKLMPAIERGHKLPAPVARIAVFGDSFSQCEGTDVAPGVADGLLFRTPITYVLDLTFSALRPIHYYYVLDQVLGAQLQAAIVEVNTFYLMGDPASWRQLRYPTLSRHLTFARALRVRTGLGAEGLGVFDPWIYRLEEGADVEYVAEGIHDWAADLLKEWGYDFNHAVGLSDVRQDFRLSRDLAPARLLRRIWGVEQTHHPGATVLRVLHEELRAAGVDVIFYVSPIPIALLDKYDLRPELDLPGHLERLRAFIGASPDEWLDLHALVDDGATFRDHTGHMHPAGCTAVAQALLARLHARGLPHGVTTDGSRRPGAS
jgi:hypothetical protein